MSATRDTDNPSNVTVTARASRIKETRYTSLDETKTLEEQDVWLSAIQSGIQVIGAATLLVDGLKRIRKGNLVVGIIEIAMSKDLFGQAFSRADVTGAYSSLLHRSLSQLEDKGKERLRDVGRG